MALHVTIGFSTRPYFPPMPGSLEWFPHKSLLSHICATSPPILFFLTWASKYCLVRADHGAPQYVTYPLPTLATSSLLDPVPRPRTTSTYVPRWMRETKFTYTKHKQNYCSVHFNICTSGQQTWRHMIIQSVTANIPWVPFALISPRKQWFVRLVPEYLKCYTLSKDLLSIFILWYCHALCSIYWMSSYGQSTKWVGWCAYNFSA
jgi:hypothetical protein